MVNSSKPVIFVVISFLVVALIYSSSSASLSAAKSPSPRDICDVFSQGTCGCGNNVEELTATCCVVTPGQNGDIMICERCSINTNTGEYYNCDVARKSPTTGGANVPQGGGVLEQPQKHPKHGGTLFPKGGGVLENPSTNQGTNIKKGNDNSPTPPACPDKGPIPPNCTLKPKF